MDESVAANRVLEVSKKTAPPLREKAASESCRSTFCYAASQLQGKWRVAILYVLRGGPVRLGELSRLLPEASKKVLIAELKRLVLAGLVIRRDLTGNKTVRHVEYRLAKPIEVVTGRLLQQLEEWNRAAQVVAHSSLP